MQYKILVTPDPSDPRSMGELFAAFDDLPSAIELLLEEGDLVEELKRQRTDEGTVVVVQSTYSSSELKACMEEAFRYHRLFGDVSELS